MAKAKEARAWAKGALRGIGDSLYTPFCGKDGDDIDWDAYRHLVRYCVGELGHPLLWLTSGVAEFWSLTIPERKQLLEVAIKEARAINPKVVIQACTSTTSSKDCLELTQHAQDVGADIVYIQTPSMEVHGGEGVMRFFEYIANRTDIALGLFNSGSSGYVMTPAEMIAIYNRVPAVCAVKEGTFRYPTSRAIAEGAPDMQVWECDTAALTAGWAARGIVCKALLGTVGYLMEFPDDLRATAYYDMLWNGQIDKALAFAQSCDLEATSQCTGAWATAYPGRPGYFTHWGEVFKLAAATIGLPVGDYPYSRPPQGRLPEDVRAQIVQAYERAGLVNAANRSKVKPLPQKRSA